MRSLRDSLRRAVLCAAALAAASARSGFADQADGPKEYAVKAAFLYNFAKYTTWPEDSFGGPDAPFVVTVLGTDPFGAALDSTMKDKKVGTHPIVVQRVATLDKQAKVHLLFVAETDAAKVDAALAAFAEKPVFVVADREGLAAKGATAGFFLEKSNVRFEMNPTSAKRSHLSISAQLLKLARIVDGP